MHMLEQALPDELFRIDAEDPLGGARGKGAGAARIVSGEEIAQSFEHDPVAFAQSRERAFCRGGLVARLQRPQRREAQRGQRQDGSRDEGGGRRRRDPFEKGANRERTGGTDRDNAGDGQFTPRRIFDQFHRREHKPGDGRREHTAAKKSRDRDGDDERKRGDEAREIEPACPRGKKRRAHRGDQPPKQRQFQAVEPTLDRDEDRKKDGGDHAREHAGADEIGMSGREPSVGRDRWMRHAGGDGAKQALQGSSTQHGRTRRPFFFHFSQARKQGLSDA